MSALAISRTDASLGCQGARRSCEPQAQALPQDPRRTTTNAHQRGTSPHFILNDNGERVTENTLRRRLYSWVRKSSLKKAGIKPHDLRRTFGTWFLQANPGHVREIAELMGHSDLSVVDDTVSDDFRDLRHGGHGKQAMKRVILTLRESFADLEVSVERHGQVRASFRSGRRLG